MARQACARARRQGRGSALPRVLRLAAEAWGDAPLPEQLGLPVPHGGRLLPWRGLLLPRGARLLRRLSAPSALGVRVPHAGAGLHCGGFLPAPFAAWRVPPASRAGPCWWCGRPGPRHLGGHRHPGDQARHRRGLRAGVPSARELKAAPGLQRQPEQGAVSAAARLAQARAQRPQIPEQAARRQARGPVGVLLPRALPPQGSARVEVLWVLALAQQAPWRRVPARARVPPGPGQGRVRRARQCRAAPGLAPRRAF